LYSNDFSDVNWAKSESSITSSAIISPDGTVNAWKLNDNTVNAQHALLRSLGGITSPYAISFFVKSAEYSKCCIENYSDGGRVVFDIANKTIVSTSANFTSASIQQYANGFIRISAITVGTTGNKAMGLGLVNDLGQDSFVGTGTKGIYVYGAQAEAGSYATSYVPTTSASVTRVADTASKTGISSVIGQTEGTLFVEEQYDASVANNNGLDDVLIATTDGTTQNVIFILHYGSAGTSYGNVARFFIRAGNVNQMLIDSAPLTTGNYKIALAYKNNDVVAYINGVQVGTDTSVTIPTTSVLTLVDPITTNAATKTVNIKQALLFKTRLTNAQLAELTAL
jgi:hypothetical protein